MGQLEPLILRFRTELLDEQLARKNRKMLKSVVASINAQAYGDNGDGGHSYRPHDPLKSVHARKSTTFVGTLQTRKARTLPVAPDDLLTPVPQRRRRLMDRLHISEKNGR